jgi:hypothetical protein
MSLYQMFVVQMSVGQMVFDQNTRSSGSLSWTLTKCFYYVFLDFRSIQGTTTSGAGHVPGVNIIKLFFFDADDEAE